MLTAPGLVSLLPYHYHLTHSPFHSIGLPTHQPILTLVHQAILIASKMRAAIIFMLLFGVALAQNKTENTIDRESSVFGYVAFPRVFDGVTIDNLETPVQFRGILYLSFAAWNAWCNYHPTAADIFGRTKFKRPAAEHTRENKNIAVLYSLYRVYQSSPHSFGGPQGLPVYRRLMKELGFDPNDRSMDMTTAVGIGNRAGRDTARLMRMDGWNSEGDITGTPDNYRMPFFDYTGYVPKNRPWSLRYPFRWQPLLENNGRGFFFRQESVTPFAGSAIAFSLSPEEVKRRRVRSPYKKGSVHMGNALPEDLMTLKKNAEEVLEVSSKLTEMEMIYAELFDNKAKAFRTEENPAGLGGIATAIRFNIVTPALDLNLDEEMIYGLGSNIATFDSMVAAWKEKRRVDAVRPTGQTMKFLFGDKKVKVWGGPGKKAVKIRPEDWTPFIRTMPHAEFPSGSSCACSAVVEHALLNTGNKNDFPFKFTVPKGSSKFYPGQLPSKDTEVVLEKLTDWADLCGKSRLYAGVHFKPAIQAGEDLCRGIGQSAQEMVEKLAAGRLDRTWMKWLPKDADKFWERE